MASRTVRAARPDTAGERLIRRSWWWVAVAFGALAVVVIVRVFSGPPEPVDVLLGGLVLVVGAAGVIHRRAIDELDQSRRQEAETFGRILQGLSRSVSPDAIVGAIVDELGSAAGADHTVVVRLRTESPILEATLVSTRAGVPSSTTMLPLADLDDPEGAGTRQGGKRAAVAIPVEAAELGRDVEGGPGPARSILETDPHAASSTRTGLGHAAPAAGLRPLTVALPLGVASIPVIAASVVEDLIQAAAVEPARVPALVAAGTLSPTATARIAQRVAERVRNVYGFTNTIAAPLVTERGVVGAIVLSRRTSDAWSSASLRVLARAAVEASAALERAYSHQEAEARASTDALTGLPNRRYFEEFCGLLARRRRSDDAVGVLMIDIDRFKRLNDEFGHLVGDQVLRAVATAINRAVREGDVPARFGGEEFAVLLRNPGPGVAHDIAERVRGAVSALDLSAFGPRGVTVSIGYAVALERDQSIPELVEGADQALYRAKRAGRDRVVAA